MVEKAMMPGTPQPEPIYFIGVAAIVISGIMLKKTKMFAGDPAPFVMELPAYHSRLAATCSTACGSAAGASSSALARSSSCPLS